MPGRVAGCRDLRRGEGRHAHRYLCLRVLDFSPSQTFTCSAPVLSPGRLGFGRPRRQVTGTLLASFDDLRKFDGRHERDKLSWDEQAEQLHLRQEERGKGASIA